MKSRRRMSALMLGQPSISSNKGGVMHHRPYVPSQRGATHPRCAITRVTRIGRAEPQARRVSHGRYYRNVRGLEMSHENRKNVTPSAVPPLFKGDSRVTRLHGRPRQDSCGLQGMAGPEGAARRRAVRGQPGTAGARRPDQSYAISPPLTPPGEGAAEGSGRPNRRERIASLTARTFSARSARTRSWCSRRPRRPN